LRDKRLRDKQLRDGKWLRDKGLPGPVRDERWLRDRRLGDWLRENQLIDKWMSGMGMSILPGSKQLWSMRLQTWRGYIWAHMMMGKCVDPCYLCIPACSVISFLLTSLLFTQLFVFLTLTSAGLLPRLNVLLVISLPKLVSTFNDFDDICAIFTSKVPIGDFMLHIFEAWKRSIHSKLGDDWLSE
jgi:hypothetical protein